MSGAPYDPLAALAAMAAMANRLDAVRVRGRVRQAFVAHDALQGAVFVHLILQPHPLQPSRAHGLLRLGRGEAAEQAARALAQRLRGCAEAELRGSDITEYEPGGDPTHWMVRGAWLSLLVPHPSAPGSPCEHNPTTEAPAAPVSSPCASV